MVLSPVASPVGPSTLMQSVTLSWSPPRSEPRPQAHPPCPSAQAPPHPLSSHSSPGQTSALQTPPLLASLLEGRSRVLCPFNKTAQMTFECGGKRDTNLQVSQHGAGSHGSGENTEPACRGGPAGASPVLRCASGKGEIGEESGHRTEQSCKAELFQGALRTEPLSRSL